MLLKKAPQTDQDTPNLPVSPLFLGVLIGLVVLTLSVPGGYDGRNYFLRPWYPGTNAPALVHVILSPLNLLPYDPPLRWTALVILTILVLRFASYAWGVRWWIALFSVPMLWNIWLGQIELFVFGGAALGWLALKRGWHGAIIGVAAGLLLVKLQAGWGIAVLFLWWLWQDRGLNGLISAAVTGGVALIALWIAYPDWLPLWIESLQDLHPQTRFFNSAIFPLGLIAWFFALVPVNVGRMRRVRLFAAATLLGSPYFANYHCATLLSMEDRPAVLVMTWLTVVPMVLFIGERYTWAQSFAWLIPVTVIGIEMWRVYRKRDSDMTINLQTERT